MKKQKAEKKQKDGARNYNVVRCPTHGHVLPDGSVGERHLYGIRRSAERAADTHALRFHQSEITTLRAVVHKRVMYDVKEASA